MQKSEDNFIFNSCNDLKFAIYLHVFSSSFAELSVKTNNYFFLRESLKKMSSFGAH